MTADQWHRHVTEEASLAIGRWLEARGRLDRSIASLTRPELEAMATAAISRFIVLASERRKAAADPAEREGLDRLLLG